MVFILYFAVQSKAPGPIVNSVNFCRQLTSYLDLISINSSKTNCLQCFRFIDCLNVMILFVHI